MGELKTDYKLTDDGMGVTIEALFKGMQSLAQSKTVVGEPIRVDDATIIPLIEVTAGLASGALNNRSPKEKGAGAMSAKLSPVAMLIMQHGTTRLVSVKNQDVFTKLMDMIPDAVDKFTGGSRISRAAENAAEGLAQSAQPVYSDSAAVPYKTEIPDDATQDGTLKAAGEGTEMTHAD